MRTGNPFGFPISCMARYQLTLTYHGAHFAGSQRQVKARTVQGELELALKRIGWHGSSVLLAGRTDTGVHASGQVAAFDHSWSHSPEELLKAINANLPADIAVSQIRTVDDTFHPRFDAIARRYRYRLFCSPVRNPLSESFAWRLWPPVDANRLSTAAQLLSGSHDFGAFGTPPKAGASTLRFVTAAHWTFENDEWRFEVQANSFLYRMVRRMVFIQVLIGQGKLEAEAISLALQGRPRVLPGGIAPAHGLTLIRVLYPGEL